MVHPVRIEEDKDFLSLCSVLQKLAGGDDNETYVEIAGGLIGLLQKKGVDDLWVDPLLRNVFGNPSHLLKSSYGGSLHGGVSSAWLLLEPYVNGKHLASMLAVLAGFDSCHRNFIQPAPALTDILGHCLLAVLEPADSTKKFPKEQVLTLLDYASTWSHPDSDSKNCFALPDDVLAFILGQANKDWHPILRSHLLTSPYWFNRVTKGSGKGSVKGKLYGIDPFEAPGKGKGKGKGEAPSVGPLVMKLVHQWATASQSQPAVQKRQSTLSARMQQAASW